MGTNEECGCFIGIPDKFGVLPNEHPQKTQE